MYNAAIFNLSGKIPVSMDVFIIFTNAGEIILLIIFNILVGTLFGPTAFFESRFLIRSSTSSALVGFKNKELLLGLFRKVSKV